MVRVPTDREPTHPGEMLRQEFLLPLGMTQRELATAIHVPFQTSGSTCNSAGTSTTPSAPRPIRSTASSLLNWSTLHRVCLNYVREGATGATP